MPADEKGGTPEVQPAPAPELSPLLSKVVDRLGELVLEHHTFRGDDRIHVAPGRLLEAAKFLRDDPALAFDFLVDVTAVDYLGQPDDFETKLTVWDENRAVVRRRPQRRHELVLPAPGPFPRFAVVYHLTSTSLFHRLRIKCRVTEADPSIPSLTPLWPAADWMERETYDMYGINFTSHPDLRRIYLYEEFVGHPLRKDYHKHHEQPIQAYVGPGAKEPRRPN
ncbi:MAG TPA: NADH-quinone oxidoreductase subunit C [Candidatus Binataceae bacterium]|nr:NADH-quinone oxidoreductase subunit C [Candidatus Binataceae bacterium]